MRIQPSGEALGACVEDIDLADPVADDDFRLILRALGEHGVLRFPH
jgi:taurine dioxygenase